ncbi:MAG: DUF6261 family protein [Verrucomicrobiales bacterium]|jgi:hypothetical protein|nr:DUF6261 family protein [Verrucomicrobiales bacterium]
MTTPSIIRFRLQDLRNQEHYQYGLEFRQLALSVWPGDNPPLGTYWHSFTAALAEEEAALERIHKSELTDPLTDLHRKREHLYRGFDHTVNAALNGIEPAKIPHAQHLRAILDNYRNPNALPYQQQSGTLNNLIQDLKTRAAAACDSLGLNPQLHALEQANLEFDRLFNQRADEQAGQSHLSAVRDIRKTMDRALRDLFEICEGQAKLDPSPGNPCVRFIHALNPINQDFARTLQTRRSYTKHRRKQGLTQA